MRLILVAMGMAAVLSGCSSVSLSPTGLAVYDTLQQDAVMRAWVRACQSVSLRTRKESKEARTSWWQRNQEAVSSADFGLSYDLLTIGDDRLESGARLAMGMTWDIVKHAEQEVAGLSDASEPEKLCTENLTAYINGERDIEMSDELQDLQLRKQVQKDDVDLQRARIEKKRKVQYGRSYFAVEKMALKSPCFSRKVSLLGARWPIEVYDAHCKDDRYALYRCEWGSCVLVD